MVVYSKTPSCPGSLLIIIDVAWTLYKLETRLTLDSPARRHPPRPLSLSRFVPARQASRHPFNHLPGSITPSPPRRLFLSLRPRLSFFLPPPYGSPTTRQEEIVGVFKVWRAGYYEPACAALAWLYAEKEGVRRDSQQGKSNGDLATRAKQRYQRKLPATLLLPRHSSNKLPRMHLQNFFWFHARDFIQPLVQVAGYFPSYPQNWPIRRAQLWTASQILYSCY